MEPAVSPLQMYSSLGYYVIIIAFIAIYYMVFRGGKNVAFKRKWWPYFIGFFAVMTAAKLAFFFFVRIPNSPEMADEKGPFMVLIVAIAAMVFMRLKNTRFCDKCGTEVVS